MTSKLVKTINSKLFVAHSGNLHISETINLMQDVGIRDCGSKILNSFLFQKFYISEFGMDEEDFKVKKGRAANDITKSELFEPIERLVCQRNSVAHSWNEGNRITAHDFSSTIIPFVKIFSKIILEICLLEISSKAIGMTHGFVNKKPINVYKNHILCINSQGFNFKAGDFIIYKSNDIYKCSQIENIQHNGEDIDVVTDKQSIDIGIFLENTVKRDDEMCCVINS